MGIRQRILDRDGYTCASCKRVFRPLRLEVDHIIPLHLGGTEIDENRQTLCIQCHKIKSGSEERNRQNG
ncbi:MAG: HNH endonuclease [Gammaproteobacteria bacterium]